ncbi:phospholipase D-like domain-containing protein, partial [Bacillus mycoides]|uniref:phospholipase D-like domain-containing protein n=1 Tax=Bacillus mycoides TaxID=1405 RepID=UPI003CC7FA40
MKAGCKIYEFEQGFFDVKIIMVENDSCDIGRGNVEMRSVYRNEEINCVLYNEEFIEEIKIEIRKDI